MKEDDPVEELHKIREAIWEEAGGTPSAYARYYYEMGQKRLVAGSAVQCGKMKPAKPVTKTIIRKSERRQRAPVASGSSRGGTPPPCA